MVFHPGTICCLNKNYHFLRFLSMRSFAHFRRGEDFGDDPVCGTRQREVIYSHSMADFWLCGYVVVAGILAFEM